MYTHACAGAHHRGGGGGWGSRVPPNGNGAGRDPLDPVSQSSQQSIQLGLKLGLDCCGVTLSLILSLYLVSEECHALTQ